MNLSESKIIMIKLEIIFILVSKIHKIYSRKPKKPEENQKNRKKGSLTPVSLCKNK